jgi:GNAT superfamily N-acetyltransferase
VLDNERRGRVGVRLLDAVTAEATPAGCKQLILDTGLGNALAQRFYFRCGMLTSAMRFSRHLK